PGGVLQGALGAFLRRGVRPLRLRARLAAPAAGGAAPARAAEPAAAPWGGPDPALSGDRGPPRRMVWRLVAAVPLRVDHPPPAGGRPGAAARGGPGAGGGPGAARRARSAH